MCFHLRKQVLWRVLSISGDAINLPGPLKISIGQHSGPPITFVLRKALGRYARDVRIYDRRSLNFGRSGHLIAGGENAVAYTYHHVEHI